MFIEVCLSHQPSAHVFLEYVAMSTYTQHVFRMYVLQCGLLHAICFVICMLQQAPLHCVMCILQQASVHCLFFRLCLLSWAPVHYVYDMMFMLSSALVQSVFHDVYFTGSIGRPSFRHVCSGNTCTLCVLYDE